MLSHESSTRPLRADAVRNQQRIVTAARELFATRGLDITLDRVAEHAGVGVGTVYRRFANKQQLITEVFADQVRALALIAAESLVDPDPWQGLVGFFESACEIFAGNRGLSEIVRIEDEHCDERMRCITESLEPAIRNIVDRARGAGVLRPGIENTDFFAVAHMVDAVAVFARDVAPDVWRRYLALLLDGMRADSVARRPLPVPAITDEQVHAAKLACRVR